MSAGGAQGLEYGPFPQDLPIVRRKTTGRLPGVGGPDNEFIWQRQRSLVEGFYEVTGNLVLSGVNAVIDLGFSIPDPSNAVIDISLLSADAQFDSVAVAHLSGDGDATREVTLSGGAIHTVNFNGVIFVPTPGTVALTWAVSVAAGSLNKNSILRLRLVR